MTSLFKAQTENGQPLSSAESTGERVQPSLQSARAEPTQTFTPPMQKQSPATSPADNSGLTTPTTPPLPLAISERSRQHADIAKAALLQLEKAGLIKRYKVLSGDPTTPTTVVKEYRIVFHPSLWTESLDLK